MPGLVIDQPSVQVGTAEEYARWVGRWRAFVSERGGRPDNVQQIDARYNYGENRVTIYRLADPSNELSVAETLSHEFLHALLYQMGEERAARLIDLAGKAVGNSDRIGGV